MSVIWQKVWADLWGNRARTILAILSIAVGVFAIGVTFGMADQMLSGMDAAHQASLPAHFTIAVTRNVTDDFVHRLKKIAGIDDVALGNFTAIRYKVEPEDDWDTAWLIHREDFKQQEYELPQLKEGNWPEGKRIGIERLSSQYFNLDIGDTVYFEGNDKPRARVINGKLRHNFVPPPEFGGPAVFFADSETMKLFDIPKGEFNQILVRVKPYSAELARQVASEIKDRLSKERIGVAVTIFQDPNEHWGRSFMEGLNLVLQMMAVVSLLILQRSEQWRSCLNLVLQMMAVVSLGASVVLVFNTLTGIITQQTNQIGILKAIGGTRGRIISVYLSGVLVYGLLSLLIALPLGMILAFGLTRYFLNLFNIDYSQFQYSTQAVILQMFAALAVPVLAGLWPVLKGASITVREAISTYGIGGDFGNTWIDRRIEQIGQKLLSAPYAVALGNIFRRKGRLLLT